MENNEFAPACHGAPQQMFDRQGNPVNEDGTLKTEAIADVDELTDRECLTPNRNVELPRLPENVDNAIGAGGRPVVIKKNIFEKNRKDHPELTPGQSREIPDLYGQNQRISRPYNWVVIKTSDANGRNRLVLLEVNNKKLQVEVVHWHYIRDKALETIKRQAEREGGRILILPSVQTEEAGGLSSLTRGMSSTGKDTDSESK